MGCWRVEIKGYERKLDGVASHLSRDDKEACSWRGRVLN